MAVGRVVKFDAVRGFGFIAPSTGGEDVFLHVNDVLIPESYLRPGVSVEFDVQEGDRGLKAADVRLPEGAEPPTADRAPTAGSARVGARNNGAEDPLCDVFSVDEYTAEATELLLAADPSLTGEQILKIRAHLVRFAQRHGWTDS